MRPVLITAFLLLTSCACGTSSPYCWHEVPYYAAPRAVAAPLQPSVPVNQGPAAGAQPSHPAILEPECPDCADGRCTLPWLK